MNVDIVAASVNTNQEMRDNHLKSGDFLLAEEHPTLTFRSTGSVPPGERVRARRRPHDPWGHEAGHALSEFVGMAVNHQGASMLGFSAKTSVDREAFGITWNTALETGGVVLGKKVDIEIDVELLKAE